MAYSNAGQLRVILANNFDNTLDLSTIRDALALSWDQPYANGAGAGQAQVCWHDSRSLAGGASENLDLNAALPCAYGVVNFTAIKAIGIKVKTTTTNYRLLIGGAAGQPITSLWGDPTDKLKISANGMFLLTGWTDGYSVGAGASDLLKVDNPSAGVVDYDIFVIGVGTVTP